MEQMLKEVKYCKNVMKKEFNKPLKMTKKDEEKFQKAEECYICNKKYTDEDIKVRDHCQKKKKKNHFISNSGSWNNCYMVLYSQRGILNEVQ